MAPSICGVFPKKRYEQHNTTQKKVVTTSYMMNSNSRPKRQAALTANKRVQRNIAVMEFRVNDDIEEELAMIKDSEEHMSKEEEELLLKEYEKPLKRYASEYSVVVGKYEIERGYSEDYKPIKTIDSNLAFDLSGMLEAREIRLLFAGHLNTIAYPNRRGPFKDLSPEQIWQYSRHVADFAHFERQKTLPLMV